MVHNSIFDPLFNWLEPNFAPLPQKVEKLLIQKWIKMGFNPKVMVHNSIFDPLGSQVFGIWDRLFKFTFELKFWSTFILPKPTYAPKVGKRLIQKWIKIGCHVWPFDPLLILLRPTFASLPQTTRIPILIHLCLTFATAVCGYGAKVGQRRI